MATEDWHQKLEGLLGRKVGKIHDPKGTYKMFQRYPDDGVRLILAVNDFELELAKLLVDRGVPDKDLNTVLVRTASQGWDEGLRGSNSFLM